MRRESTRFLELGAYGSSGRGRPAETLVVKRIFPKF